MGAQRATDRDRDRIDQRAIDEPAAVMTNGWEKTGDRIRGSNGIDQCATSDPNLLTRREIGGHRYEGAVERIHREVGEGGMEDLCDAGGRDGAARTHAEIEKPHHPTLAEAASPALQLIQMASEIGGTDQRADRCATDHVGLQARGFEPAQDTDVCPATSDAASQGNAEKGSGGGNV